MSRKNVFMKKTTSLLLVVGMLTAGASCQIASAGKKPAISHKKIILTVGETKTLKVKNTKKKVSWSSKNKKIATVSKKGVVKAKKKGTVKIIGKIEEKKYVCKVKVQKKKQIQNQSSEPAQATTSAKPQNTVVPTAEPTATPTLAPTPVRTPKPTPDPHWYEGKKSGTEEDFNRYFALDMKQYQRKQEGTVLGTLESITYHSEVVGADREAYVYLPPHYSKDQKYPVLYMIHGIGCDRGQWVSLSLNNILSNMICSGEVAPLVAVVPSVIPKDGINPDTLSKENIEAFTLFEQEFLKDLEPYILNNYSVSSERKDTGVCGLSMGGMEALHLGFSIKDHFNYIGSFSAAPTLNQELLTLEGWTTVPEMVFLCSGSADGTVSDNPYDYHMKLEQNGVDHIWYLYPNGGHDDKVWKNGLTNFLKRSY